MPLWWPAAWKSASLFPPLPRQGRGAGRRTAAFAQSLPANRVKGRQSPSSFSTNAFCAADTIWPAPICVACSTKADSTASPPRVLFNYLAGAGLDRPRIGNARPRHEPRSAACRCVGRGNHLSAVVFDGEVQCSRPTGSRRRPKKPTLFVSMRRRRARWLQAIAKPTDPRHARSRRAKWPP